nr:Rid family detoxifying hydrolase [Candidatus Sigynarchaeota archaeon]
MKKQVTTRDAPPAIGPYSQAVDAGQHVYLSGQIPLDASGSVVGADIEEQTQQVFKNMAAVLAAAGLNLGHVVKCQVFITNMDNFPRLNDVYKRVFESFGIFPARTTVEVSKLPKGVMVEIDAIAARA